MKIQREKSTISSDSNYYVHSFKFISRICSLLLDNFYFNPNRKLKSGYCSIIVKHVTKKHIGQWTCAGRLVGRNKESWDDFSVHVFDSEQSTATAAVSGMIIGAIAVLIVIGGVAFFAYKRKYMIRRNRINNDNVSDTVSETAAIPMENLAAQRVN